MRSVGWSKLMVIQPWFSALGHPAQSALSFSRVVPRERVSEFLIPEQAAQSPQAQMAASIARNVPLRTFRGHGSSLRLNTVMAALRLIGSLRSRVRERPALFFLDADLLAVCALVSAGLTDRFPLVGVVYLGGPEQVLRRSLKSHLVGRALRSGRLRLFLRSVELLEAWQARCPELAGALRLFPPIEAAAQSRLPVCASHDGGPLRIGVVGQIRVGKCIPQLLRLAEGSPEALSVAVQGPLYEAQPAEFLNFVRSHPRVHAGFMSEEDMLQVAARQDYLAGLLEQSRWDVRMESATFWLGIRSGRPILCFGSGWIGRMVRDTGCGIILATSDLNEASLRSVPTRDSPEYRRCLESIDRLRGELTPEALWAQFERSLN